MSISRPEISVVIPCFNAEFFLSETIESITNQTFENIEIILINDGSTDTTSEIIKNYAQRDERIIMIEKENSGPADSRNRGIFAAKGEWIAIQDADDIALPSRLELQLAYCRERPELVLIGSDAIEMTAAGCEIKSYHYPNKHSDLLKHLQRLMAFPPHSSLMYRAEAVRSIGGFNTRYVPSEDWDLWLRLAENGMTACLNKPLMKIRKHAGSISNHAGGRTQTMHGLAATVCHFLRSRGAADVSLQGNEEWRMFMEWIVARMEEIGFFQLRQQWAALREQYLFSDKGIIAALHMIRGIIGSKHAIQIIHDKYYGSSLPRMLADEWVNRQLPNNCDLRRSSIN